MKQRYYLSIIFVLIITIVILLADRKQSGGTKLSSVSSTITITNPRLIPITILSTPILPPTYIRLSSVTKTLTPTITEIPSNTITNNPTNCYDTALTQYDLDVCASKDRAKEKYIMQLLLNEFKSTLDPDQYEKLLVTQEKWEEFVDNECAWELSFFGGASAGPMWYEQCYAIEYAMRINYLRGYLCPLMTGFDCVESLKYKQTL
jgi:uncharacterized protein YecT (DUF1311 family)